MRPDSRLVAPLLLVVAVVAASLAAPATGQDGEIPDGYARLVVITDFDTTEIEVNGVAYPYEWIFGDMNGVLVPADRYYQVSVAVSPEQRRTFRFELDEGETRVIVADITNMGQVRRSEPTSSPQTTPRTEERTEESAEDDEDGSGDTGFLGVSSSPRGIVYVDGASTDQRTPARRIEVQAGRHEVQVFYEEDNVMSEVKHVLIRARVNTNVFFRLRRTQEQTTPE